MTIPDNHWRSTAWLDDLTLPPRFGIVTSNMSESMNNMFEKARDGSWLNSMDTILGKMMERISLLRKAADGKSGVVVGSEIPVADVRRIQNHRDHRRRWAVHCYPHVSEGRDEY